MKNLKNKKIAIIGGGPGGLTLARLLQMKEADVKVFERDYSRSVRVQGATLDLHEESGLKALEVAGLMNEFKQHYRPGADRVRVVDKSARILFDEHDADEKQAFRPEIDRGPLRTILLDSLKENTVIWNSHFKDMQPHDGGWELHFENGNSAYADLVIGADGANSRIRPYITDLKPFYAGVTIIEGSVYNATNVIPDIHELLKGGKLFALGNEKTLILSSKGDGSITFYAGFKCADEWVKTCHINFSEDLQVMAWFRKEFHGWNELWNKLIEYSVLPLIPRPQYCMPVNQGWSALSNLTMLGDAAHLMPPYAGEGVNMAMLDALELSMHLTSDQEESLATAIASYEQQMCARAWDIATMTLEQTEALHSSNAIDNLLSVMMG